VNQGCIQLLVGSLVELSDWMVSAMLDQLIIDVCFDRIGSADLLLKSKMFLIMQAWNSCC